MKKLMLCLICVLFLIPVVYGEAYKAGSAELYDAANAFLGTTEDKIAAIIPAAMVILAIVCLLLDFGVIGVTLGSILSLISIWLIGIIPINFSGILSIVVLGVILMFKLRG